MAIFQSCRILQSRNADSDDLPKCVRMRPGADGRAVLKPNGRCCHGGAGDDNRNRVVRGRGLKYGKRNALARRPRGRRNRAMMPIVFSRVCSQSMRSSGERIVDCGMPRGAQLRAVRQRPVASAGAPTAFIPARGSKSSTRVSTAGFWGGNLCNRPFSTRCFQGLTGLFRGLDRWFLGCRFCWTGRFRPPYSGRSAGHFRATMNLFRRLDFGGRCHVGPGVGQIRGEAGSGRYALGHRDERDHAATSMD